MNGEQTGIRIYVHTGTNVKWYDVPQAVKAARSDNGDWAIMGGDRGYDGHGHIAASRFVAWHPVYHEISLVWTPPAMSPAAERADA